MEAQEFRARRNELQIQIGDLMAKQNKMFQEQMALIRKDLEVIGLTYGTTVTIVYDSDEFECTFNDVRVNYLHQIYLEFVCTVYSGYDMQPYSRIIDTTKDFTIVLPNATTFEYREFMSNYQ